jgi:hypothetical protein
MKRNEGCEKDYGIGKGEERIGGDERLVRIRMGVRGVSRSFAERAQGGVHIIFF